MSEEVERPIASHSHIFHHTQFVCVLIASHTATQNICNQTNFSLTIRKAKCSSFVIDGGVNGSYDRSLYQSENMVNSEIVAALDSQVHFNTNRTIGSVSMDDIHAAQDAALC
jgi:hypothetical protein